MTNKITPREVFVVGLARWLSKLQPAVWIAIFLVLCVAICAVAWGFKRGG